MSAARGMERRLAAVWFADIVEYTRLAAEDEEAALALVREFQAAARAAVESRGGRIVKFLGDGALAEFASTQAAAQAALELQTALAKSGGRGAVRVGIHLGEVSEAVDGDLYGDGVNVAARVQAEAEPGAVVVSDDVARQLRGRREIALEPLGARTLKGVPDPVRIFVARLADAAPAVGAAGASQREPAEASIAVLPFANLSADPDNEYFSDGVTEEILTSLGRLDDLKVISRTSVMRYKGTTRSMRDIGRELGVNSILEGSVRRAGSRVRITAQLIDARTDRHLWADRYDRDLEDIFAIQTEVAERIVEVLQLKLTPRERARLTADPTSVPAYQEYLRGLWFLNRRTPDDLKRAIDHFERSVAADPSYAPAHAGVASACALQLHWGRETRADPERAVAEAERARELDAGCGEACAARGMVRIYERDWAMAEDDFQCALKCNPNDATAHQWYAHYLAAMGRFDEASDQIARARELDPLSLAVITEAGNVHLLARRYEDATRLYRAALDLDPTFTSPRYKLMELAQIQGRYTEALAEMETLGYVDRERAESIRQTLAAGDTKAYFALLRSMPVESGWPLTFVAWSQIETGDKGAALDTLERAVAERDWYLIRLPMAPHWDPLRGDPRFAAILKRIDLDHVAPPSAARSAHA